MLYMDPWNEIFIRRDLIQYLQYFWNDSGCLPSKLYTDLNKRMIWVAAQKWLLENISNIVASPMVRQIKNGLVNWKQVALNSQIDKYPESTDTKPSPTPTKLSTYVL